MDMKIGYKKLDETQNIIETIMVPDTNNKVFIEYIGNEINDDVIVRVYESYDVGKCLLYNRKYNRKQFNIYKSYIPERVHILLQDYGKLSKEYEMVQMGHCIYKVLDNDISYYRDLTRTLLPLVDLYDSEGEVFDLILSGDLHDYFVHPKDELVYALGSLYINGQKLCNYSSIKKIVDPSITEFDLYYFTPKMRKVIEHLHTCNIYPKTYCTKFASGDIGE